jgi:hypothetical protein
MVHLEANIACTPTNRDMQLITATRQPRQGERLCAGCAEAATVGYLTLNDRALLSSFSGFLFLFKLFVLFLQRSLETE